ncbi:MAG: monovalent cation/H(+) antiporter subunit G [Rhodospirillaceae bacterium]|jgi:multicomponent Na+:H+ antiporter subunit G|nr:monovalent cation/H(+) antiporter subunit G [Rhodospirillaceae bacterium]MBT3493203.1 monovalent cation/H(+) antiporter subunit G [Rhodospirillaceae bacterium]MBT3782106.1 monovalent cation/H(+) antiporter subunit G [Rhodospirillaceae bacterium]MBT3977624.1 monovalent cation/H(+) antiporter subunit G [Rhodospirillaceae bacterium]MBT4170247.1 monovalent cation/H(+) antiporter subunit G [Rhodospirillaceae bacterium]
MAVILDILSWFLLIGGSAFVIIGAFGMWRLPDFYSRLHPAGLTDTMGAGLILLGLLLQSEAFMVGIKLLMIAVFLMFTSPTSGHATARAALAAGLRPWQAPEEAKKLADENDGGNKDGAA